MCVNACLWYIYIYIYIYLFIYISSIRAQTPEVKRHDIQTKCDTAQTCCHESSAPITADIFESLGPHTSVDISIHMLVHISLPNDALRALLLLLPTYLKVWDLPKRHATHIDMYAPHV